MPASASDHTAAVRLHITPLTPVSASSLLPASAINVSYHTLETFPERSYGFCTLPAADAATLKKKYNNAMFRGQKVQIRDARPHPPTSTAPGAPAVKIDRPENKVQVRRIKVQKEDGIYPGFELPIGRKVQRGWDGKSKVCLVNVGVPPNRAALVIDDREREKIAKKRKILKGVIDEETGKEKILPGGMKRKTVIKEGEKAIIFPAFLRENKVVGKKPGEMTTEFVEEVGWVDAEGRVVEDFKKREHVVPEWVPPPVEEKVEEKIEPIKDDKGKRRERVVSFDDDDDVNDVEEAPKKPAFEYHSSSEDGEDDWGITESGVSKKPILQYHSSSGEESGNEVEVGQPFTGLLGLRGGALSDSGSDRDSDSDSESSSSDSEDEKVPAKVPVKRKRSSSSSSLSSSSSSSSDSSDSDSPSDSDSDSDSDTSASSSSSSAASPPANKKAHRSSSASSSSSTSSDSSDSSDSDSDSSSSSSSSDSNSGSDSDFDSSDSDSSTSSPKKAIKKATSIPIPAVDGEALTALYKPTTLTESAPRSDSPETGGFSFGFSAPDSDSDEPNLIIADTTPDVFVPPEDLNAKKSKKSKGKQPVQITYPVSATAPSTIFSDAALFFPHPTSAFMRGMSQFAVLPGMPAEGGFLEEQEDGEQRKVVVTGVKEVWEREWREKRQEWRREWKQRRRDAVKGVRRRERVGAVVKGGTAGKRED